MAEAVEGLDGEGAERVRGGVEGVGGVCVLEGEGGLEAVEPNL